MKKLVLPAIMAMLPGVVFAYQLTNRATAEAYSPAIDEQTHNYFSLGAWDAAGRSTLVTANSDPHPFDPPANHAKSWSRFDQQPAGGANAVYKSFASVGAEYNATGSMPYRAVTSLDTRYQLEIQAAEPCRVVSLVPVHGIFAARTPYDSQVMSSISSSMQIWVDGISIYSGSISAQGDQLLGELPSYSTTGLWNNRVAAKEVADPLYGETIQGLELSSLEVVEMGRLVFANSAVRFDMEVSMESTVTIPYGSYSFSVADFSATTGINLEGRNDAGEKVDITVTMVPVPEPATFAALGLASLLLLRRRRR